MQVSALIKAQEMTNDRKEVSIDAVVVALPPPDLSFFQKVTDQL